MQTKEFIALLKANPGKRLVFEYANSQYVPETFHITEIKNNHTTSVDCGGNTHQFNETVVQLWVNPEEDFKEEFTAAKALKIVAIVNGKYPVDREAEILFEYGHLDLVTSNYKVKKIHLKKDSIIVKLFVPSTVCKPRESGETVCC